MTFQNALHSLTMFAAGAVLAVSSSQPLSAQAALPDCASNAGTLLLPLIRPALLAEVFPCTSLVGTWQVQVSPDGVPSFTSYNVFFADGNSTEFDNSNPPFAQTIAVGPWKRTGDKQYSMLEINQLFDGQGNFAGTFKVTAKITLDPSGNTFTSKFEFQVLDTDGHTVFSGTGTAAGKRLIAE